MKVTQDGIVSVSDAKHYARRYKTLFGGCTKDTKNSRKTIKELIEIYKRYVEVCEALREIFYTSLKNLVIGYAADYLQLEVVSNFMNQSHIRVLIDLQNQPKAMVNIYKSTYDPRTMPTNGVCGYYAHTKWLWDTDSSDSKDESPKPV